MEQVRKLNKNRSWLKEEDDKLRHQINAEAKPNWKSVASKAGLKRTANGCRQRYINHLKPGPRPGKLTVEEKVLILEIRSRWGGRNCWSKIAKKLLPGRTDNDLKNFWHTLAKKANREGRDANSEAILKRAELVKSINDSGKFTTDYSSLISSDAYDLLKELFPRTTGGGAATESADSSPIITDGPVASVGCGIDVGKRDFLYDLDSSSAATDIGAADAATSSYSVDLSPRRIGYTVFSQFLPTTEVDQLTPQQQYVETPQSRVAVEQQLQKGLTTGCLHYGGDEGSGVASDPVLATGSGSTVTGNPYSIATQIHEPVHQHQHQQLVNIGLFHDGGGPTAFNQVPAAALGSTFTETSNRGVSHMQVTSPNSDHVDYNIFVNAPQLHAPMEQHEQPGFNSSFLDHGGGSIGLFNKATAAALGNTTSSEIDSSYAEEELGENKAFGDYFDFDDFL